jgi:hypothetical protein
VHLKKFIRICPWKCTLMIDKHDVAGRRFRAFKKDVLLLVSEASSTWEPSLTREYCELAGTLVDTYLDAVPSLRQLMKPATFARGARTLVLGWIRRTNPSSTITIEYLKSLTFVADEKMAVHLSSRICKGNHVAGKHGCSKCFMITGSPSSEASCEARTDEWEIR